MSGYNGFSMSNNATAAYEDGLRPASKIKGIPAELVRDYCVSEAWHHCSSRYNEVEFFSPEKVRAIFGLEASEDQEPNPAAVAALAQWRTTKTAAPVVATGQTVEWLDWGGTRKHPWADERRETGCTVAVKGQTATITLPNGTTFVKRLATRGFGFGPDHVAKEKEGAGK